MIPGEIFVKKGEIVCNEGRPTAQIEVTNTGDRPIQVGSHFHFFEVNKAMAFDRGAAFGMRLNIPAGTAIRFEPGEGKTVELVALGGARRVIGINNLVNGDTISDINKAAALQKADSLNFKNNQK